MRRFVERWSYRVQIWIRKLECAVIGHDPMTWIGPGPKWSKPDHGWCAYCASSVKAPPRLRR